MTNGWDAYIDADFVLRSSAAANRSGSPPDYAIVGFHYDVRMLVAMALNFLSTLCQQTVGRLLPINVDRFPTLFHQQTVIDNPQDRVCSCPVNPPLSTTERTVFGIGGCTVYGYPSTGGILIKKADLLDMLFLSLPRSHVSQRSPSVDDEDRFCNLLRRTGATFWPSREDWFDTRMGLREITEEEEKVIVYGWPTDGVGVWVLRFKSVEQLPRDFGRISLAMNMEEKIQIMREYGATFVEDVTQCTYPQPKTGENGDHSVNSDLVARVESIESKFQSLERSLAHITQLLHMNPSLSSQEQDQLRLEIGQDRGSSGWSGASHSTSPNDGQLWQSFPLRPDPSTPLEALHPSPAVIAFIWQTYLDVVDPVLKVFHVPTVQRQVTSVIRGRFNLDAPTECLIFAIYYSTVVTMSAEECREEFDEDKAVILTRYRTGVEQALSRANFLTSLDLTVLQAFALYLICGRRDGNGPDVCTLIGVAIGTAMKIGLHCDGAGLGLSPFEAEMRRRLWWQICTLDVRTAEDHGSEPTILESTFNTELPLNINDTSLEPDMSELPQSQLGKTEMTFTLVRFEGSHFARRVAFSDRFCRTNTYPVMNEAQKREAIEQFKELIEKQYLSFCDKEVPLDFITAASIRLILVKLKLAVCRLRRDQAPAMLMQTNYRRACEEVLQRAQMLRNYEKGKRWLWLFQTYVEWDSLAYLLLHLCIAPPEEQSDAVWKTIDEIYHHWKSESDIYHDRRWRLIEKLRYQAVITRGRRQNIPQSPRETQPDHYKTPERRAIGPAVRVYGDSSSGAQQTTSTKNDQSSNAEAAAHAHPSPVAMVQTTESNPTAEQPFPMGTFVNVATATSATQPVEEAVSSVAELPSGGTGCEWSAALFEIFWDLTGSAQGASVSWL
ncbi:fungal specific transcription factor [Aspergillus nomiae NRRL 13137]|uniref:Fungal specific transcription factor n=1 Tax=Aspergillus nomiae NRRL (strain ATCC 15546 / NRRL 13137 / CBS 260.88 / M93) TaxID=1509407 RepID=A0A0L1IQK0_ASPN3|nr:fungal specific transcription factor [Aspergillus nomiae NRRL 13137]KNG81759.1 fungal specific transcription factor [Aspergillus nomiae NRRL 13137]